METAVTGTQLHHWLKKKKKYFPRLFSQSGCKCNRSAAQVEFSPMSFRYSETSVKCCPVFSLDLMLRDSQTPSHYIKNANAALLHFCGSEKSRCCLFFFELLKPPWAEEAAVPSSSLPSWMVLSSLRRSQRELWRQTQRGHAQHGHHGGGHVHLPPHHHSLSGHQVPPFTLPVAQVGRRACPT